MKNSKIMDSIKMTKFSVLMSVYIKEKPDFLEASLYSILVNQSIIPDEIVLVKDGPLTSELESVIDKYYLKYSSIIKLIALPENIGLGKALNIGLDNCSYELVARMDSDDISHKLRFQKQLEYFHENPYLDLVGGNIEEFFDSVDNIKFIRKVPIDEHKIKKMIKRRNPFNHVSVMFSKTAVIKSGGYKHLYFLEDYYLWIRMISSGFKLANVDETFAYVRTGDNMYKRRGNPEYIRSWYILQKEMYKAGFIRKIDILINMISIIVFINTPSTLKKNIYKIFLRSN